MKFSFNSRKYYLLIISILLIYSSFVFYTYNSIKSKDKNLLISRLSQDCTIASKQVSDFIGPIYSLTNYLTDQLYNCEFDIDSICKISDQLSYVLDNYSQFSSITIASETGNAFSMARLSPDTLVTIEISEKDSLNEVKIKKFSNSKSSGYLLLSTKTIKSDFSILDKPWVKKSLLNSSIYYSDTYEFYYSKEVGITISKRFLQKSNPGSFFIIGLDVMIKDIFSSIKLAAPNFENDFFLLNNQLEIIPYSYKPNYSNGLHSLKGNLKYDRNKLFEKAQNVSLTLNKPTIPFEFKAFSRPWYACFKKIRISECSSIYIGIIHPDYYFQKTGKKVLVILVSSFLVILLLFLYLLHSFSELHKKNKLLISKNFALAKSNYPLYKLKTENTLNLSNYNQTSIEDVSSVSSRTAVRIIDELELLISNKFFLNPDINLYTLSKILDTNTSYLSKVINEYLGKNFSEFLKELRINEAIIRIGESKLMTKYSMEGFAHELGFKSKSSFNVAFKKYTGITPSEFINSIP